METYTIDNPQLFALNVVMLSVLLFTTHVLLLRSAQRQVYLPLAICMFCIAIIMCQPILRPLSIEWRIAFLILSLPAMLLLPPCFWCYARGLTGEREWRVSQESRRHWLMPGLGFAVALFAFLLPADIQYGLLAVGNDKVLDQVDGIFHYVIRAVLLLTLFLVLAWTVQSGVYFVKTIRLLNRYRLRLKDIFASTEHKEIRWLTWLLFATGIVWCGTVINLIVDNLIVDTQPDPIWVNITVLFMVWSLSVWGLRQKPGFEDIYESVEETTQDAAHTVTDIDIPEELSAEEALSDKSKTETLISRTSKTDTSKENSGPNHNRDSQSAKYQRSALNEQQSQRIAMKIRQAMEADKLYLDPNISLQKLAKHTGTSSNYISQTLNETLGLNFFDFVNQYRVDEAKHLLRGTDMTILDIAMRVGFNAKSSFYKAFKKETQQTPSKYRKAASD